MKTFVLFLAIIVSLPLTSGIRDVVHATLVRRAEEYAVSGLMSVDRKPCDGRRGPNDIAASIGKNAVHRRFCTGQIVTTLFGSRWRHRTRTIRGYGFVLRTRTRRRR